MKLTNWQWYFADEQAEELLGDTPQALLTNAEVIKQNPVRRVYRSEEFFIKADYRTGHSFRREFEAAQLLERQHLPVVRHLAWSIGPGESYLITQAAPGTISADRYIADKLELPVSFVNAFGEFVAQILNSKVFHPDFHLGNLLWQEATQSFLLVDVHGVRPRHWCDRFQMYRMRRILLELRQQLTNRKLAELAKLCHIPDPDDFLSDSLHNEALKLRHDWPRRRRQIISGYPKFCRRDGNQLVASGVDPAQIDPDDFEKNPRAGRIFCANFLLNLMLIPHRRVLACDFVNSALLWEKMPLAKAPVPIAEQIERLEAFGISTDPEQWHNGRLLDFAPVLSSPWFTVANRKRKR